MKRLAIQREVGAPALLRDFLLTELGISRKMLVQIKQTGELVVNGEASTVRRELVAGDLVEVVFPSERASAGMTVSDKRLDVMYEDEAILVVDKQAGLATIPSRLHPDDTLANRVLGYYQRQGIASTIHVVNRLDRDTSGIVVFAKHAFVHHLMSVAQRRGEFRRTYEALAHGTVAAQTIDAPIARKEGSIMERCVAADGQRAVTHVLESTRRGNISRVRIRLETGRTHQIRVHLSHLGCPLVGDTMYGGEAILERHALHSATARFPHPFSGEELEFVSELPEELLRFWDMQE